MATKDETRASYYAALPVRNDAELLRLAALVEETGWSLDQDASVRLPDPFQVVRLDEVVEAPAELSDRLSQLREELVAQDVEPRSLTARYPTGVRRLAGSEEAMAVVALAQSTGADDLGKFFPDLTGGWVIGGDESASDDDSSAAGESAAEPEGDATKPDPATNGKAPEKKGEAAEEAPAPAAPSGAAATIAAAGAAFPDPSTLWRYVKDEDERGRLAKDVIESRARFARRSEWTLAPEMVLLESCEREQRAGLAKRLLETRAELTGADDRRRDAGADLAGARRDLALEEVQMAKQRVALATQGVGVAAELLEHMKKWRSIANWGIFALCVTTIFSMAMVYYVLHDLMPNDKVSDAAAPVIIFVLALFAVSPAVLLLRERPLEGIDKWSPGGGGGGGPAEEDGDAASGKKAAAKGDGDGAAKPKPGSEK